MAEIFNSYIVQDTSNSTGIKSGVVVIPYGLTGSNTSGLNTRAIGSSVQVHSFYVSQEYNVGNKHFAGHSDTPSVDPDMQSQSLFCNVYIENFSQPAVKYYILNDAEIMIQNSLYLEKTITLKSDQRLCIEFPNGFGKNSSNRKIFVIASGVEIL